MALQWDSILKLYTHITQTFHHENLLQGLPIKHLNLLHNGFCSRRESRKKLWESGQQQIIAGMALFPGPPVWAGARRELLYFMVQGELPSVLWHCWLGSRKGIRLVKNMVDGGGHWLVRMELRPAGWSVSASVKGHTRCRNKTARNSRRS